MANPNVELGFGREASSNADVDQLLHPSRFYARPSDVVGDELLTIDERRAILSSWASDACAVESNPPLRRPSFAAAPVTFDEVMDALLRLDRIAKPAAARALKPRRRMKDAIQQPARLSHRDAFSLGRRKQMTTELGPFPTPPTSHYSRTNNLQ